MRLQDLKDQLAAREQGKVAIWIDKDNNVVDPMFIVARRVADLYRECPEGCTHERFLSPCDGGRMVARRGVCWWGKENDEFITARALARYLFGEG